MHARLSGTGSLQTALGEIFSVLHPIQMRDMYLLKQALNIMLKN